MVTTTSSCAIRSSTLISASSGMICVRRSSWYSALRARSSSLMRSEEHTSELQSRSDLVCRLLLEKKKQPHLHSLLLSPPLTSRTSSLLYASPIPQLTCPCPTLPLFSPLC